jgi:tRNA 5-methylaminomethyl-2-thiouridine biosynthesis bifunctional protein
MSPVSSATPPSPADTPDTAFLTGCNLPAAWAQQPQWRVLDTRCGDGLRFLSTWAAWRADPDRPRLLHYVALQGQADYDAVLLKAALATGDAVLHALAQQLHAQLWGLLPGLHRIALDGGQVLLTLCVGGDALGWLRQQAWTVESIFWDGLGASVPDSDTHAAKVLVRSCRRGTQLAALNCPSADAQGLARNGFVLEPASEAAVGWLRARYLPRWEPRTLRSSTALTTPARCVVIGGGLAGAASAASLARRGWQVQVLDAGATPASGASGLPVGVFAPHLSPDDNLFSRVSRSGVRALLQQGDALLQTGEDWQPSGVLERRPVGHLGMPSDGADGPGAEWSRPANAATLQAAGLPVDASACWHARAGWVRPECLVTALLAQPGIHWRGDTPVARLQRTSVWQVLDAQGDTVAEAELVVLAAGPACNALLAAVDAPLSVLSPLPLQSVRGQLSWGLQDAQAVGLPPFPVNGHGGLVANVPQPSGGQAWAMGSTFERDVDHLPLSDTECAVAHASNWQRLQQLLPGAALALQAAFDPSAPADAQSVQAWAGVRCTAHDRLPIVGPINAAAVPGLWVCTAMGARGLTRAVLCGELLAAQLHSEPLPVEARLAQAMSPERFNIG